MSAGRSTTSKFALEGWTESLRFDLEPGVFRTELLVEGASSIWPEQITPNKDLSDSLAIEA